MARRRPPVEMPKVTNRSSSNEWSGSAPVADRTSRKTVAASSNETPCLARSRSSRAYRRVALVPVLFPPHAAHLLGLAEKDNVDRPADRRLGRDRGCQGCRAFDEIHRGVDRR